MTNGIPFGLILPVYDIIGSTPATGVAVSCCTGRVLDLIAFKTKNDVYHEVKGCVYNIFKKGVCKITLIENFVNIFCREMSDLRWLDTVFQGQYLPSLSINYVAINKVLEKLPPQLY